ncbi:hypothetical protein U1Q18_052472 [Sarracenia purpurea var. burkii]
MSLPEWKHAMNEEMSALHQNQTWEFTSLPPGKQVVGCRRVYAVKYISDGSVDRFKTCLMTEGYTQTCGVNYMETFSWVARLNYVRFLLSVAVNRSGPLYQLNIKNAFIHDNLQDEVHMDQPPDFIISGNEHIVCRLRKALYGLKQSLRA